MLWLPLGMGLLVAVAIIAIGIMYVSRPMVATRSFGLPLPEGANIEAWLRLKGVRDIVSGLTVLTFMAFGVPRWVGVILFAFAIIPIGDMLVILASKGSVRTALSVHGLTAVFMIAAAILLTV